MDVQMRNTFILLYGLCLTLIYSACESTSEVVQSNDGGNQMGMVSISVDHFNKQKDHSLQQDQMLTLFDLFLLDTNVTDTNVTDINVTDINNDYMQDTTDMRVMTPTDIGPTTMIDMLILDRGDHSEMMNDQIIEILPEDMMVPIQDMMPALDFLVTPMPDCDPTMRCTNDAMICTGDVTSQCMGGVDEDCQLRCITPRTTEGCRMFTRCESRSLIACQYSDQWTTLVCERDQRCINDRQCGTLPAMYGRVCNSDNTDECIGAGLACGGWAITLNCLHPDVRTSGGRRGAECYTEQDCWIGYFCSRAGYCTEGKEGDHCLDDQDCLNICNDSGICIGN